MLFYVKVNGKLEEASLEQIMDTELDLYNEEGKLVGRPEKEVEVEVEEDDTAEVGDGGVEARYRDYSIGADVECRLSRPTGHDAGCVPNRAR